MSFPKISLSFLYLPSKNTEQAEDRLASSEERIENSSTVITASDNSSTQESETGPMKSTSTTQNVLFSDFINIGNPRVAVTQRRKPAKSPSSELTSDAHIKFGRQSKQLKKKEVAAKICKSRFSCKKKTNIASVKENLCKLRNENDVRA